MDDVARIVLALEEHDVAEEVMHFLDRSGRARVVATAIDDRQLAEAVRQLEPDAIVGQPKLLRAGSVNGSALIALDTTESVAALRTAIAAGARGFYVWPAERTELAEAAAASKVRVAAGERQAVVAAVYGPRGGVGVTFLATHLAQAAAHRGLSTVLVDMDPVFADVSAAIGATASGDEGSPPRTMREIAPMLDDVGPDQLVDACWAHPSGFRVLLAPTDAEPVDAGSVARAVDLSARATDAVVLHLPRGLDPFALAGLAICDRLLMVLSLDVLSFHTAKRAVDRIDGPDVGFVVNRASRAEVTPNDVRRVFGVDPLAVLPWDAQVSRAQDGGRLLPAKGRLGRAIDRLAGQVFATEGAP